LSPGRVFGIVDPLECKCSYQLWMEVPDDACVLKNDTVCDPEDVRHFIRVEPSIHELLDVWIWLKRRGIYLRPGMSRDFAAAFSTFIIREIVDPVTRGKKHSCLLWLRSKR